jgi:imidazolonepropionase-like amidohydrolase
MRVLNCFAVVVVVAVIAGCAGAPSGFEAAGVDAPAYRRGVNVNHWLSGNYDESHTYGAAWFDAEDVGWIAAHGFDHIRLRVTSLDWLRADGTLDPAMVAPLDAALGWARAHRLGVVVAMTAFPGRAVDRRAAADFADPALHAAAVRLWGLVAARYAGTGDALRFELIHVPWATRAADLAAFQRACLAAIRAHDRRRFVYLTPNQMAPAAVGETAWPDDPRTGLAFELWDPVGFTQQYEPTDPPREFPGPGPGEDVAAIDRTFAALAAWAARDGAGRELYVAQFGVYHRAPAASQQRWLRATRAAIDRHQLAWAVYDYDSGCAVRGADGLPTTAYESLDLGPPVATAWYRVVSAGALGAAFDLRSDRTPAGGADVAVRFPDVGAGVRQVRYRLDAGGMPAWYQGAHAPPPPAPGTDPAQLSEDDRVDVVDEQFTADPAAAPAFYIPVHDDPLLLGDLARRLLAHPGAPVATIPRGTITLEPGPTVAVAGRDLTGYVLRGLDLEPVMVWLGPDRGTAAVLDDDSGFVAADAAPGVTALIAAQRTELARLAAADAARVTRVPAVGTLIRNARVFDPVTMTVTAGRSILITGGTITAVGADGAITAPTGVDELDAAGRFVMPGLWDSHTHLFTRGRAILELAAGVTTVRDMGNEGDLAGKLAAYEAGTELGPRAGSKAVRFGFADEPSMPRVTTRAEADAVVASTAARGYQIVKVLDQIDPALVPYLARITHARRLRFTGHLPAAMTVPAFVAAGADEIHHVMALLRHQPRDARALDAGVRDLLALMARERVTLDPTLAQFEIDDHGRSPAETAVMARMPPREARAIEAEAVPAADRARVRRNAAVYTEVVAAAVAAGVTVVPGTDARLSGLLLHRELALYAEAGIPAPRVLRMATYAAAANAGAGGARATIAAGQPADLIVVDGDPSRDVRELARIDLVIARGRHLVPAELRALLAMAPE